MIPSPWRLIGVAVACAATVAGYLWWAGHQQDIGEQRAMGRYEAAIAAQKQEVGRLLAHATARALRAEIDMQRAALAQAEKDNQNATTIRDLGARLAAGGERLRDPAGGAGCGRSGGGTPPASPASAASGAGDTAEAPGLLSADLSRLLRDLTRDADHINAAYIASRLDAERLRGQCYAQ